MFLAEIKDNQKKAFMTLAHAIIVADNILEEQECAMMAQYKSEMNLSLNYDESEGKVDDAIAVFLPESDSLKKKIVFELVALAYMDGSYVEEERVLIKKIQADFGLDVDFFAQCEPYIVELAKLYEKIGDFVG